MKDFVRRAAYLFIGAFLLSSSCKEAYDPQIIESQNQYLVVEGMLNNSGPTSIKLSRTRPLGELREKPELKAVVSIESENNHNFLLTEKGGGEYTIQLNLDNAKKYRLRIKTANGKEYLSGFVPVIHTPVIDSISWKLEDEGLRLYVDTHDPQNNARYYQWSYEETWVRSIPASYLEFINNKMQRRKVPIESKNCYSTRLSNSILLASSAKITKDVIRFPINFIRRGSVQLTTRYSILVKQYALEQKAYEYWQLMKKNEQLGSIFDPQPSYMYGNIYSVNDTKEMVIGYFGACNVTEKRIFITPGEAEWHASDDCKPIEYPTLNPDSLIVYFGPPPGLNRTPLEEMTGISSGSVFGYTGVLRGCLDCLGSTIKPSWWKE